MNTSSLSRFRTYNRKGFTLMEILVVVVIIGVLALMFLPETGRTKGLAELNLLKTKASALNVAQATFVSTYGLTTAMSTWAGKTDDERYVLLKPFIGFPPPSLADYVVAGYTISFANDPQQPVGVTDPNGNVVSYN